MRRSAIALFAVFLACLACMCADSAEKAKIDPPQKPNPAFAPVQDVQGLPRVLLIGDSISIGYTLPARELLKGKVNVHRIPVNGGPTSNGLKHVKEWLGTEKWDVIHFNWGLHDLKYMDDGKHQVPIEGYETNLKQLVETLKQTGAKLIWASTTPVPPSDVKPKRNNDDVVAYNAAAQKIMKSNGVAIDDLYAVAASKLGAIQRPNNVHFTDDGSRVLAEQVAKAILGAL
jgi:lysophospholipase L1-like esterase